MAIYYYCSRITPDTKSWEDLKKLLNIDLAGKREKITFISGCINDKSKSKSYRNGASKNLVELGLAMKDFTLLWKNTNPKEMAEQIQDADIVYLLGGNPHEQTSYIKDNCLDDVLRSYNGIVIGVSCGSMTMSKNVITPKCGEKYQTEDIRTGLQLTNLSVFPHFDYAIGQETVNVKDGYILISDLLKISNNHDILALPNEAIIRYSNEDIYLMGEIPYLLSGGSINKVHTTEDTLDNIKIKKLTL